MKKKKSHFFSFRNWYRKFHDEIPSGVLTKPQLTEMYSKIIPKEDPGVIVDHLFRIFDRDGNGTIDFKEFVMATDMTTAGAPEEKLKWTFRVSVVSRVFLFDYFCNFYKILLFL